MTIEELRAKLDASPDSFGKRHKTLSQEEIDLLVEYRGKKTIATLCRCFGIGKDTLYRIYNEEMERRKNAAAGN